MKNIKPEVRVEIYYAGRLIGVHTSEARISLDEMLRQRDRTGIHYVIINAVRKIRKTNT